MLYSNIFDAIDTLESQFLQSNSAESPLDTDALIQWCKTLFNKVTEFMKCAERNCGAIHYQDGFPHSQAISDAAEQVNIELILCKLLDIAHARDRYDFGAQ